MLSRNYTWLLLLGFGLLSAPGVNGSAALSPERSTTSGTSKIGDEVAVDAVDLLFLFDHLFMKSSTAISTDYLKRIADPKSPFHATYVAYEQRKISRREVIERLPHVAVIGDSLSKNAYVSSIPSMFWRVRTARRRDWFLDTDPSPAASTACLKDWSGSHRLSRPNIAEWERSWIEATCEKILLDGLFEPATFLDRSIKF